MKRIVIIIFTLIVLVYETVALAQSTVQANDITENFLLNKANKVNKLTLQQANSIINAAFIEGKKLSLQPLSIAILDAGGQLIAFQRQDNASILRFDIAFAKAYGALGMGMGSRGLAQKAKEIPDFINGAIRASKGRLIPAPGGVLILNSENTIIGAAGVSGDTSDHDEHSAIIGIQFVGLTPKVD